VDFIVLVLPVLNGCDIQGSPVWENQALWFLGDRKREGKGAWQVNTLRNDRLAGYSKT
jgi:hypothetical protein